MKPILFFILKLICMPLLGASGILCILTAFILWDKKYIPNEDVSDKLFKRTKSE